MTTSYSLSKPLTSTPVPWWLERRNRGFTLIHAETVVPIARLRPIGRDDLVDILYWSLWKERWAPFGPFGRTADAGRKLVETHAAANAVTADFETCLA